jgi:hypothetical protein
MCTSMHVLTWSRVCVHTYTCGHDGAFVCIYARLNMIALMCTYIHVLAWSLLCVRTYKCGHDRAFVYIKMWALLRLCVHTYMDGHDHADVYLHTCYCNICTHRNTQANNVYVWAWSRICVHKREGTLCLCVHTRTCGHDHAQVYIHRWAWSHSCVHTPECAWSEWWRLSVHTCEDTITIMRTYTWGHVRTYVYIHVRVWSCLCVHASCLCVHARVGIVVLVCVDTCNNDCPDVYIDVWAWSRLCLDASVLVIELTWTIHLWAWSCTCVHKASSHLCAHACEGSNHSHVYTYVGPWTDHVLEWAA